jgi:hypothetical protein
MTPGDLPDWIVKALAIVGIYVLFKVGSVLLGAAIPAAWRTARRACAGRVVPGTVVALEPGQTPAAKPIAVVAFSSRDGVRHQFRAVWAEAPAAPATGHVVRVSYDTAHPEKGEFVRRPVWLAVVALTGTGLTTVAILLAQAVFAAH